MGAWLWGNYASCRIAVVPGATHLFEEPGALEQVAELARDWFVKYLAAETTDTIKEDDQ